MPEDFELRIDDLIADGLGRGRIESGEVRLKGALPGERVSAVIRKRSRGLLLGDAKAVHEASEHRIAPACPVAHRCGGCVFQHVSPAAELEWKSLQLTNALHRAGVPVETVRAPVRSPLFGYRRKARLGVRRVNELVLTGFREAFSGRVVDMHACPVLDPRLSALIDPLREIIGASSIPAAIPQVEVAAGDDATALVLRHLEALTTDDEAAFATLLQRGASAVWLQSGGPDSLRHLAGSRDLLSYANPDFGLLYRFGPLEFVQVNPHINRALVRAAVSALHGHEKVLDLFCGLGNFSLALARMGHVVRGFESGAMAVGRAADNAQLNGLAMQASFADLDLYGPDAADLVEREDAKALLLDPPRSGAGPNLARWLQTKIQRVVYVSCNPVTFASDAAVLRDAGFVLLEAGIHDMFPQTSHVETFGVFARV